MKASSLLVLLILISSNALAFGRHESQVPQAPQAAALDEKVGVELQNAAKNCESHILEGIQKAIPYALDSKDLTGSDVQLNLDSDFADGHAVDWNAAMSEGYRSGTLELVVHSATDQADAVADWVYDVKIETSQDQSKPATFDSIGNVIAPTARTLTRTVTVKAMGEDYRDAGLGFIGGISIKNKASNDSIVFLNFGVGEDDFKYAGPALAIGHQILQLTQQQMDGKISEADFEKAVAPLEAKKAPYEAKIDKIVAFVATQPFQCTATVTETGEASDQ